MPLAACLALGLVSSLPPPAIYPPRGEQIVPADCRFVARLKTKIYSDKSKIGDPVELENPEVVRAADGAVYIPSSSVLVHLLFERPPELPAEYGERHASSCARRAAVVTVAQPGAGYGESEADL